MAWMLAEILRQSMIAVCPSLCLFFLPILFFSLLSVFLLSLRFAFYINFLLSCLGANDMAISLVGNCSLVTGVPGAGKTLGVVSWLADDWLRRPGGALLTNIRIHPDVISEWVSRRCNTWINRRWGYAPSYDDVFERLHMMSQVDCDNLHMCMDIEKFFTERLGGMYENAMIIIDEVHTYCGTGTNPNVLRSWANWLATVRHSHIHFVGITQDISQVDRCLKSRVESRLEYLSPDSVRDPYLKITMQDWFQLVTAIRNVTTRVVCCAEYQRSVNGRWKLSHKDSKGLDEAYFRLYDSFQRDAL